MYDDVLTRNENEELAVRTVSSTEQQTVVNPNDVYTRDTDGNLAVRVVGGGGTNIKTINGNSLLGSGDLTIGTTPATAPTLVAADWSANAQTITVSGVTSSNVVFVSPAPASVSDYTNAGIICTAQGTDSLSFSCVTTPTNDITLNVVIF